MKSGGQSVAGEQRKPWTTRLGNVLVFIGVSMWGPYAIGKYLLGWDVSDRQFLPYHLAVIIPGMALRHFGEPVLRFIERLKSK
jgi:hypothetical protein